MLDKKFIMLSPLWMLNLLISKLYFHFINVFKASQRETIIKVIPKCLDRAIVVLLLKALSLIKALLPKTFNAINPIFISIIKVSLPKPLAISTPSSTPRLL